MASMTVLLSYVKSHNKSLQQSSCFLAMMSINVWAAVKNIPPSPGILYVHVTVAVVNPIITQLQYRSMKH